MSPLNLLLSSKTQRLLKESLNKSQRLKVVMAFEKIEALILEANQKDFDMILLDHEHDSSFHIEDLRELFPKLPVVLCCENRQQLEEISKKKVLKCNETVFTDELSLDALEQICELIHAKHQIMLQQKSLKLKVSSMQSEKRERDGNIVMQQNALLKLAKIKFKQEILDHSFENIGRIVIDTLGIERFSIWIMDSHLEQLKCECYITNEGYHGGEDVPTLYRDEHQDYFTQLENGDLLSVEPNNVDHQIHSYLNEKCLAVIEAPLFEDGVVYGSIRFEELCEPRSWMMEELSFADAVSDMVTMAIDQWELHRVEEDHRRREADLKEKLQESNVELQQFSSIVSHDLQDPLYKIQAFGELLDEICRKSNDEQAQFYIQRILNASTRMRQLIQDLLAFTRVESRGHSFEDVDLNEVFKASMIDLEIRISESRALIKKDSLPTVSADLTQMEQLFRNILGNAIKFRQKDKVPELFVSYQLKLKDGVHVISFTDNGIGIDISDEEKIFGVFQRLYNSQEYEGTGMGLAIVQKIVKRHGWKISAHGEIGKGTKFTIEIPIRGQNHEN